MWFCKLVFAHYSFLAFSLTAYLAFGATLIPDEVEALRKIAETMGKKDWNFNVDPCSGESGWVTINPRSDVQNEVTCNCSFSNDAFCHVTRIVLEGQNLTGKLPPELVRFPHLQVIHLNNNYLKGTVPPEWGSMQLLHISATGNRISGSIPKELGNIPTLLSLTFEFNQLSGGIPPELGKLTRLKRLYLTSNNLSGELPTSLGRLTALKEFWIGDNHFMGQIPNYIRNWLNLEKLFIQASGLNGPIPSGIAALVNLRDLRISDLNGPEQPFPPLNNMKQMKILILRSCNINGGLPQYIGEMNTTLETLDLSFNKLSGGIPSSYASLVKAKIYFTGNLLTGSVPTWISDRENVDLSYNNFTVGSSGSCQQGSAGIVPCLRSSSCPHNLTYLHINCGGEDVTDSGNTTYEDDLSPAGPSTFFRKDSSNWAFSSTGHFMDDSGLHKLCIGKSASRLSMKNSELYMNARLSPISLTYYGYCLGNGKYRVELHFAEIMFTDDETYRSLGRRIFDIYIQGKLVEKDFNIAAEADGIGKAIIKKFKASVTNNILEIRFYWAGRGTTAIPTRGVYGPLISAISAVSESGHTTSSVGKIVGIVVSVASLILLVVGFLWWKGCIWQTNTMAQDLKGLDLQTGSFTLRQIKAATNNFDDANKIGEGGFGAVYKGLLSDGTVIAVKQLSSKSKQGNREFMNEIGMISAVQHPYLVKLYGCCAEGNELLLVYEYLENNSLARALFGPEEHQLKLDWPTRHMICVGIARGLAYLHEESRLKIVHRDIKATNVLLDKDLNPKISDFGLAKLDEEDNTHISTRIAGTLGYMAPEYALHGYLTDKADIYSFGIVALEIVSGRNNRFRLSRDCSNLLEWARNLKSDGSLLELVDPRLGSDFNKEEAMEMVKIALLCTNVSPSIRPAMSSVVSMLEGRTIVPELASDSSVAVEEMKFMAMKKHFELIEEQSLLHGISMDGPSTTSSASVPDLYPVNFDASYLANRDQR